MKLRSESREKRNNCVLALSTKLTKEGNVRMNRFKGLVSGRKSLVNLLAIAITCGSASTAFASGHGGHGGEAEGPAVVYIVGVVLNFIIFVWILYKYGKPALSKHYAQQREELLEHLDTAKKLREKAEQKLHDYEKRLNGLETEREEILARYRQQGESERDRLILEAKSQIEKMEANAKAVIAQEQHRAVKELEQEAVDLAVRLAEEKLKVRVNEDTDQRMVERLTRRLEQEAA